MQPTTMNFSSLMSLWILTLAFALPAPAFAEQQQALFFTHDDPRLEWGPCPGFFPQGCAIAVLHGDPTEPNADIFFRVPANAELPKHWHTSAERMVLVSGKLHLTFEGQDSQAIQPGTYIYGPAKLAHKGRCAAGDPCVLFIAFEEPVDAVPGDTH